jgi:hypothetical protein
MPSMRRRLQARDIAALSHRIRDLVLVRLLTGFIRYHKALTGAGRRSEQRNRCYKLHGL